MSWQVLNATKPGSLSLKNGQCLYCFKEEEGEVSFPLNNLGVIVIECQHITISAALLNAAAANNIVVFICGDTH